MKINPLILFLILISSALLTGCLSVAPPESFAKQPVHKIEQYSGPDATIGSAIIKRQDYWIQEIETAGLKASDDFSIEVSVPLMSNPILKGMKGEIFRPIGRTLYKKEPHLILQVGSNSGGYGIGVLIKENGIPTNEGVGQNLYGAWVTTAGGKAKIQPAGLNFNKVIAENVLTEKGFQNYEIIYTGISENTINLLYREFTSDDLAKPAFYQNLQYDLSKSNEIRFKNILIDVKSADNQKITYSVTFLEDM